VTHCGEGRERRRSMDDRSRAAGKKKRRNAEKRHRRHTLHAGCVCERRRARARRAAADLLELCAEGRLGAHIRHRHEQREGLMTPGGREHVDLHDGLPAEARVDELVPMHMHMHMYIHMRMPARPGSSRRARPSA